MEVESVNKIYLRELVESERSLAHAEAELSAARAKFELASRKYGAARDWITLRIGNPYSSGFEWPDEFGIERADLNLWGKYRFINMSAGDAIKQVLRESEQPLALNDIVDKLHSGRMPAMPRSVNAALMKVTGVLKTSDDKYVLDDSDTGDLPF